MLKAALRGIARGIYIIFFRPFVRPLAARLRGYLNEGRAEELAKLKADIMGLQRQLHERAHAETHSAARTIVQVIEARHEAILQVIEALHEAILQVIEARHDTVLQVMRQDVRRLLQEMTQSWQLIRDFIKNDIRMASVAALEQDKAIISQLRYVNADLRKELASSSRGAAREVKDSLTQILGRVDTAAEIVRREIVETGAGKASAGDVQKALRDILDGLQATGSDLKKAVAAGANATAIGELQHGVTAMLNRLQDSTDQLQQSIAMAARDKASTGDVSDATVAVLEKVQTLATDIRQVANDITANVRASSAELREDVAYRLKDAASAADLRQAANDINDTVRMASSEIREDAGRNVTGKASTEDVRMIAGDIGEQLRASVASLQQGLTDAVQGHASVDDLRLVAADIAGRLQAVAANIRADVAAGVTGTASADDVRQASAAVLASLQVAADKLHDAVAQTNASKASAGDVQKAANDIIGRLDGTADDLRKNLDTMSQGLSTAISADVRSVGGSLTQRFENVDQSLTQAARELSETIAAETANLATVQGKFQARITERFPQFDRLELYGYTAARRLAVPSGPNELMVRTLAGYVVCDGSDTAVLALLMETGDLEPGTRLLIEKYLAVGDTFIDIGANLGLHTIAGARAMSGTGRIIAFEPYGPTKSLLEKTIWMNGFSAITEIHQAAVSKDDSPTLLYLGHTSGHHSLFPLGGDASTTTKIKSVRLDEIVRPGERVDLIKIDVEGAELDVLDSAATIIDSNTNVGIIVEFGPSHLQRVGQSTAGWFAAFRALGLQYRAIDPLNGTLHDWPQSQLEGMDSINLFFAKEGSVAWSRAGVAS